MTSPPAAVQSLREMKYTPHLLLLWLLACGLPAYPQYVHLKERLDNDYLVVTGDSIRFTYREKYSIAPGSNDLISCRILDRHMERVGPAIPLPNAYGRNEQSIPLPRALMDACQWYLLEVSGFDKGSTGYLRFRLGEVSPVDIQVHARAWLAGAYEQKTGLMHDRLREKGLIPASSPYPGLGYRIVTGCGEDTPVSPAVLGITGEAAIVDWVLLELRPDCDPGLVSASRAALIRRDGRIVDTDGSSPVSFCLPAGRYHLSLRHRNHLGVMTQSAFDLHRGLVQPDHPARGGGFPGSAYVDMGHACTGHASAVVPALFRRSAVVVAGGCEWRSLPGALRSRRQRNVL